MIFLHFLLWFLATVIESEKKFRKVLKPKHFLIGVFPNIFGRIETNPAEGIVRIFVLNRFFQVRSNNENFPD